MPPVIGIDPSMTATGVALVDGSLRVCTGAASLGDQRLVNLYTAIVGACASADLAVIEDLPANAKSAGITGMAQAAVRLALLKHGVPYARVVPSVLKKYATGNGSASKADMRMALYQRTGTDERDDNKVDAAWLRAMGLDHLGQPLVELPQAQRAVLQKVRWP